MAKTKKFKTIAGYFRNIEETYILAKQVKPGTDAERAIERRAINQLLPQGGITETIADSETPLDGVKRIRELTTDPDRMKTLDACRKWLKRWRLVGVVSGGSTEFYRGQQVTTAEGLVSHEVNGFRRDDHKANVRMIVDVEVGNSPFQIAENIAGPEYCFHAASNIHQPVPDVVKNRLFTSDNLEELFTAVPELKPYQPRRAAR